MDFTKIVQKKSAIYAHIESLQTEIEVKKPLQQDDYFRASSIYKMCPREEALYHKYNIERKERITPGLWRTFKFGRMYERFFRDELLGNAGILIGVWRCKVCEWVNNGKIVKPSECEVCGAKNFEYVEEDLIDSALGIGGHPDGTILWEGIEYLLELKTTNSFNFNKVLAEPMAHHIGQMQIYMHILKYQKGLIWYFNKDTSQDICHEVDYNQGYVEQLLEKPKQYKHYLKTQELPPRICFDPQNKRANKCKVCKLCFA